MKTASRHPNLNYIEFPGELTVKCKILHMLLESQGKFLSGNELGTKAGISGPAIWKNIQALLKEGFPIETTRKKGYRITGEADILFPPKIHQQLTTKILGRKILYTSNTTSTNNDAKLIADFHPDGTLLICETQTQGKGRLGRQWESPRGGIFLSLILKPEIPPGKVPALSLIVGYAAAKTLQSEFGLDAVVKWPNDVLINQRKILGILCEMRAELDRVAHVIVGIGLNANISKSQIPQNIRQRSTSILEELETPIDRNLLIASLLNKMEPYYLRFLESGLDSLIFEIEQLLAYVGSPVTIHNIAFDYHETEHGTLEGLDKEGRLLLRTPENQIRVFTAGDVSLRPK